MNSPKINIPGVFWSALLIALAAFIQANFQGAIWYQAAMLVIAAVLKGMDVGFGKIMADFTFNPPEQPASRSLRPADEVQEPSAIARWFMG